MNEGHVEHVPIAEGPGTVLGRYKLREQLGEGGMGAVYLAEQERPVRRKVALKIIKPGLDTKDVIARFQAERQALALMDHPNIARVLDAGATGSGRPYFVMELVRGIPITEYCDQNRLLVRDRVQLFVQVCQAIQHAHQKGIIHRDVKPSNVLISLHDGRPVPKVIDFGVAKAINQRLTDRTIYTRFAQVIGTPAYMSPEQAELSGLDIDTRSDVYSLGVLLYELLTGTTPFDRTRFESAAFDEIRRIIREEEPPKPSTKISTLGQSATAIAAHRKTDPRKLHQQVRGDLDWIVMKALEKDRTRRYETASSFATDMRRYLDDQPIEARAPSLSYVTRKFFRRSKTLVTAGSLLLIVLLLGIAGTGLGWWSALQKKDELNQLAEEYRGELIDKALIYAMSGNTAATSQLMAKARLAVSIGAKSAEVPDRWEHVVLGQMALYGGNDADALNHLQRAVELAPDDVATGAMLASAYSLTGREHMYEQQMQKVMSLNPLSARDFLFLAQAQAYLDPRVAEKTLHRAAEFSDSPLLHAIKTEVLGHLAIESGSLELARAGLAEVHAARLLMGDNAYVLGVDLFIHMVAMRLARAHNEPVDDLKREADRIASKLDLYPLYGVGLCNRAAYYDYIDDADATKRKCWEILKHTVPGTMQVVATALLYRHGEYELALAELRIPSGSRFVATIKAEALALTPNGRDQALQLYEMLRSSPKPKLARSYFFAGIPEIVPCLLGMRDKTERQCRQRLASGDYQTPWERSLLQFIGGQIAPDDFIQRASSSGYRLSIAHRTIALDAMSKGELDRAEHHFEKCLATNHFNPEYFWAQAYLARLKNDSQWRAWIAKKGYVRKGDQGKPPAG